MTIEVKELNELGEKLGVKVIEYGDGLHPGTGIGTLYALGNTELLREVGTNGVTISGSRASTGYGEHVTMQIVTGLVQRGHVIVTGGAYGIEGMATRAALANDGKTVIVLAGGVNRFYPSGHDTLFQRVLDSGGLIISEAPTGSSPTRERFSEAAAVKGKLTPVTLITEAGARSGALQVAVAAYEAGSKVYGIPGPVTSAASAGVHELIKSGVAELATHANDIEL